MLKCVGEAEFCGGVGGRVSVGMVQWQKVEEYNPVRASYVRGKGGVGGNGGMRVKGRGEGHGAGGGEVETRVYYERVSAMVEKNLGESVLKNLRVITIRHESKRCNNLDFIRSQN